MRRPLLPALLLLASTTVLAASSGCLRGQRDAPQQPPARPGKPAPIVVALVIDQMSAWAAAERWPLLPASGGLARLRREGAWMRDVRYAHAACDTAPGHAAIHTGLWPRETGIAANERMEGGKAVPLLRDGATFLVDDQGVTTKAGSSIAALRVDTIADRFRRVHADGAVVSVSLKDRAAIFGGGRAPDAVLWFEAGLDRFVTSTAFASSLPAWARPHATTAAVQALRARPWELLDAPFVAKHAASADDAAGEGDLDGLGSVFPHAAEKPTSFRATPFADQAVLALANAAIAARDPGRPMLLSISLSANDYVAHVFGPDSFEAWDTLLRIDAGLGRLFDALDAAVAPEGWSAVLTGDHGSVPLPEVQKRAWCAPGAKDRWERPCEPGLRLEPVGLRDSLDAAAVLVLGPGRWIDGVTDPWIVYSGAARALDPARRDRLDAAMVQQLGALAAVHSVHVARRQPAECPSDDSVSALVCRSTLRDGLGDLYVVTRPGSFFDTRYVVGKGMNHGSPWLFDRSVPLLVRGPGRVDAGVVRDEPVSFATTTRALAALLGIAPDPRWLGVEVVRR